jgi:hypothetical protein
LLNASIITATIALTMEAAQLMFFQTTEFTVKTMSVSFHTISISCPNHMSGGMKKVYEAHMQPAGSRLLSPALNTQV